MGKESKKKSRSRTKSKRALERKERKALEERIKKCKEKCEEGRGFLEPSGKNAEPNYVKAKAALETAIEIYGNHSPCFFYLGECSKGQGELENAIAQYSHALDLDPTYVRALEGRAACYQAKKDFFHAVEDYTSIIQLDPANDHAYNSRGLCYVSGRVPGLRMKKSDFEKCMGDFKTAVRLNEANYYALCNLGRVYEDQGEMELAVNAYTSALRVKDDYAAALFRRGCTALRWVEMETRSYYSVDEYCGNLFTREVGNETIPSNKFLTVDQIENEIRSSIMAHNKEASIGARLDQAITDFLALLPVQNAENTNRLTADVSVVMNLAICYMLKKVFTSAEEYFKYADDIIKNRPELVADGLAHPIEDLSSIKAALALRKEELHKKKMAELESSSATK